MGLRRESRAATVVLASVAGLAVVAASALRSLHEATPRVAALGPFGSPLFLAAAGLLALHLVQRRRDADLLHATERGDGLTVAQVVPLLVAVFGEKWVSIDVLGRAYEWIWEQRGGSAIADPLYRLWTGLALLGCALALVLVLRQIRPRLAHYLTAQRAASAFVLALAGFAVTALALYGAARLAGGGWARAYAPALGLATAAQVVRGTVEELFYRGLLQTAFVWLLIEGGLPDRRPPRVIGIAVVSVAFALEHLNPHLPLAVGGRRVLFVFMMSVALGTLLEVSRNLYLPMVAHTVLNLLVIGALPLPAAADGLPLVPPDVAALLFFVTLFFGIVIAHRRQSTKT